MTNLEVIDHIVARLPALNGPDAKAAAYQMAYDPFRELNEFLSALPRRQMLAVITTMYFGRDDCVSILSMQAHCDYTFPDSGIMAWQMLNKSPVLAEYFERAKQRALMDRIDLNQLPLTPAVAT